ncbi:MAG: AraC family transcriptional regulator [Planctomycetes bacterium]|nr:AraC family transcriptional regulator [Planctomycetota bacterium]
MSRRQTLHDYSKRVLKALEHAQRHLDDDLSPERLARVAAFSPFHFQRIFRGLVGESVMEHVRRLRLERAARRLTRGRATVTAAAMGAGYESHEAFSRAFRRHFGCSPSSYRRERAEQPLPEVPSAVHFRDDHIALALRPSTIIPPGFPVIIESRPAQRVAYLRHTGPYEDCSKAWDQLGMWAARHGHFGSSSQMLGLCHDDPEITEPHQLRYDACLSLDAPFETEDDIGQKTIAGGDFAVVRYRGPYEGLSAVYQHLIGSWLPRSGWEPVDGPCIEVYWNDPESCVAEDLETDVCLPLSP